MTNRQQDHSHQHGVLVSVDEAGGQVLEEAPVRIYFPGRTGIDS